jgi:hypothetical protein
LEKIRVDLMTIDRRDIAPFLIRFFPDMTRASSNEWHFFLDAVCGLETPLDMPNGQAFDRWREKLAVIGYPVLKYTPADIEAMRSKAEAMAAAEAKRGASMSQTLGELAKEAPNWTAAEVLASTKAQRTAKK